VRRNPAYLSHESLPVFFALSKCDLFDIAVSLAAQVSESSDDPGGPASLVRLAEEIDALSCAGVLGRGTMKRIETTRSKMDRRRKA